MLCRLQVENRINKGLVLLFLCVELGEETANKLFSNLGNINVDVGRAVQLVKILFLVVLVGNNLLEPFFILCGCYLSHVGEHEIDFLGDRLKVNSYHNYAIKSIENAKILASSTDGYIEAFSNEKFKILGAMWHFERESKPSQASKKIFEILKGLK